LEGLNGSKNATSYMLVLTVAKPIPFLPQQLDQMVLENHLIVPPTRALCGSMADHCQQDLVIGLVALEAICSEEEYILILDLL
jgi:hypothetical protein